MEMIMKNLFIMTSIKTNILDPKKTRLNILNKQLSSVYMTITGNDVIKAITTR